MTGMRRVLDFLGELHANNNREWFNAHKEQYLEAKSVMDDVALKLLDGVRGFDDSIGELSLSDIRFRIYRDVRFAGGKGPYKNQMSIYIAPGGRKSGYCGYYFQVSAATDAGWESGNMIAAGNYFLEKEVLKTLREDIEFGDGDFRKIISGADPRMKLDTDNALKKVPAGFDPASPEADLLKLKNFSLTYAPDDDFVLSPDLIGNLLDIFRSTTPFLAYLNRAIRYVRENQ